MQNQSLPIASNRNGGGVGGGTISSEFNPFEFITALESDLSVLMELQDAMATTVSPEDIKKPLSIVRKRLLRMLDRSLYHRLSHLQKVTIAKAN